MTYFNREHENTMILMESEGSTYEAISRALGGYYTPDECKEHIRRLASRKWYPDEITRLVKCHAMMYPPWNGVATTLRRPVSSCIEKFRSLRTTVGETSTASERKVPPRVTRALKGRFIGMTRMGDLANVQRLLETEPSLISAVDANHRTFSEIADAFGHQEHFRSLEGYVFEKPAFKLLVCGDKGTGKTSFCKRHVMAAYRSFYEDCVGVDVYPLEFSTTYGPLRFYGWDRRTSAPIGEKYYFLHAHCAIIIFDVTSRLSYGNLHLWYNQILRFCNKIPIVICGNKVDDRSGREVQPKQVKFHRERKLQYYEISAKSNYNFEEPFLYLARKLVGKPDLQLYASPALDRPLFRIDNVYQEQNESELV